MFPGFGTTELLVLLALAMLIFGPKKLPDLGRSLGKATRGFKSTVGEIEDVKKSTIGQVDDLKDSLKVDLDLTKELTKEPPKKAT